METPDNKLNELMKDLADSISQAFSGNEEIRQTLSRIEKEGYHVDMILASVTRVSRIEEDKISENEVSNFDRSFLSKIRIRLEEEL